MKNSQEKATYRTFGILGSGWIISWSILMLTFKQILNKSLGQFYEYLECDGQFVRIVFPTLQKVMLI